MTDFTGDNFLAVFPTALDAVRCAVAMQRALGAPNADLPTLRRMEFRMGIHLGDVRVEGERICGSGVSIAARLEALAEVGGICISATVREQVRNQIDVGYIDLGNQTIKNIPKIPRVGPLTRYDTALRIGAYLELEPKLVYLHAGTREGSCVGRRSS